MAVVAATITSSGHITPLSCHMAGLHAPQISAAIRDLTPRGWRVRICDAGNATTFRLIGPLQRESHTCFYNYREVVLLKSNPSAKLMSGPSHKAITVDHSACPDIQDNSYITIGSSTVSDASKLLAWWKSLISSDRNFSHAFLQNRPDFAGLEFKKFKESIRRHGGDRSNIRSIELVDRSVVSKRFQLVISFGDFSDELAVVQVSCIFGIVCKADSFSRAEHFGRNN